MLWTWHYMIMILSGVQELIEKVSKGELPKNEYPCMNEPSPTSHGNGQSVSARPIPNQPAHSMRSRRTATWAKPRHSDDGSSRYFGLYFFSFRYITHLVIFISLPLDHHHKFLSLGCFMLLLYWLVVTQY